MFLKSIYEKAFNKVTTIKWIKKITDIPIINKLLQYEVISYLFFGVLTTVVNFLTYFIVNKFAGSDYENLILFSLSSFKFKWIYLANAIAWIVAVIFAFITNKIFVFESQSKEFKVVAKEFSSFVCARLISFLIFEELLFALITALLSNVSFASWIAKIITSVLVIIFNYIASKIVIFKEK